MTPKLDEQLVGTLRKAVVRLFDFLAVNGDGALGAFARSFGGRSRQPGTHQQPVDLYGATRSAWRGTCRSCQHLSDRDHAAFYFRRHAALLKHLTKLRCRLSRLGWRMKVGYDALSQIHFNRHGIYRAARGRFAHFPDLGYA